MKPKQFVYLHDCVINKTNIAMVTVVRDEKRDSEKYVTSAVRVYVTVSTPKDEKVIGIIFREDWYDKLVTFISDLYDEPYAQAKVLAEKLLYCAEVEETDDDPEED